MRKVKKDRKDTPSKCKQRIQKLLRELAILLYKDCEAKGIDQQCGGPLQADHIETRGSANTYASIANIILLCYAHHFFWKRRNPGAWALLVEEKRGAGTIKMLHDFARINIRTHYLKDWQRAEEELKKDIAELKNSSTG